MAGSQLTVSFFLLYQVRDSSLWVVLPTFRVGLPSSVTPLWKKFSQTHQGVCLLGDSKCSQVDKEE